MRKIKIPESNSGIGFAYTLYISVKNLHWGGDGGGPME